MLYGTEDPLQRLRLALEAAGVGTFAWHIEDDRLEADARVLELLGCSAESPIGFDVLLRTVAHPDDAARFRRALARATDPEASSKLLEDIRLTLADGSERWRVARPARSSSSGLPPTPPTATGAGARPRPPNRSRQRCCC
jgi:PAS domain-containing protein